MWPLATHRGRLAPQKRPAQGAICKILISIYTERFITYIGENMDIYQREAFWKMLTSLDGKDLSKDKQKLDQVISTPRYLYRYRPVNTRNLDALRTNKLYFSTSDYYDDPFDTFIHINIRELLNVINAISNNELEYNQIAEYARRVALSFNNDINDEHIKSLISRVNSLISDQDQQNKILSYFRNIRNEIKKDIWSVCFSENGLNEVLWLKYAQQHKGFAVQYDLSKPENLKCGQYEKCSKCGIQLQGTMLYPIVYSNEHYNGTRFAQYITCIKFFNNDIANHFLSLVNTDSDSIRWEPLKISLIKKMCHHYDEEWRMILNGTMKAPVMCEWKPDAVILGLNIETEDRNLVLSMAREAGISTIYESYINDAGELDKKLLL